MIRFKLFGSLEAVTHDGVRIKFATRKVALVTAWLATTPQSPWSRSVIADRVWPESYREIGLASLRQALSSLRKSLEEAGLDPDDYLDVDRGSIGFRPDRAESDFATFQSLVQHFAGLRETDMKVKSLQEALELTVAPFLGEYENSFVTGVRDKFRSDLAGHRRKLVELLVQLGRPIEALEAGAVQFYNDPTDELLAGLLIEIAQEVGRSGEAVRIFESLNTALDGNLGLSPSAAITGAIREVRETSIAPPLPSTNLRRPLRRMIGRDEEMAKIQELLQPQSPTRLLTLLGPGGIGKTTLSREVAYSLLNAYNGAVWFTSLTEVRDAGEIMNSIREVLGLNSTGEQIADISRLLGRKSALIVLDNLEQILGGARLPISELLEECPSLKFLTTSRKIVGVAGEQTVRLGPLSSPRKGSSHREIISSPSVDLFLDRARSIAPDYEVGDPEEVGELCRRLDGLPLALCLAAAKADVLTVNETVEQLENRFSLLAADMEELEERHRRLWSCIDWSYGLIPEANRLFAILSVFRGGWSLDSAREISDESDALSQLQTLRRHCLIEEIGRGKSVRFGMLESIHDFAQTKLEDKELFEQRHAEYFTTLAERSIAAQGSERQTHFANLDEELDNLRKAFEYQVIADPVRSLHIAVRLSGYFMGRGRQAMGWTMIEAALVQIGSRLEKVDGIDAHLARAQLYRSVRRDEEGRAAIDLCMEFARGSDVETRVRVLSSLAGQFLNEGRLENSVAIYREGLDLSLNAGLESTYSSLLGAIAVPLLMLGHLDECRDCCSRALVAAESAGDPALRSGILYTMAHVALMEKDLDSAQQALTASIEALELADMNAAGFGRLTLLAELHMLKGDWDSGLVTLKSSVEQLLAAGMTRDLADCASRAALWCEHNGKGEESAAYLRFYEPYMQGFIGRSRADWRPTWEENCERVRKKIGQSRWSVAGQVFGNDPSSMAATILRLG